MGPTIEHLIVEYLGFQVPSSESRSKLILSGDAAWQQALTMTDTAGLTLHLRARLIERRDFSALPPSIQDRLECSFTDNIARSEAISGELAELNLLFQSQGMRYLNLKGQLLYPDFVDQIEHRVQYDHDFLFAPEDLSHAYQILLDSGYVPVPSSEKVQVGHLPTLIKQTNWQWKGNLYDPEIPRGIEVHFQLWDSEYELISIHSLEEIWKDATSRNIGSISMPVLSRKHMLLHCVLHTLRHLLRNDLRLSHLYELAYFIQRSAGDLTLWEDFFALTHRCANSKEAAATMFELACHVFNFIPTAIVRQSIAEHLTASSYLWIHRYGRLESIHCYRRSKKAVLLHLGFIDGSFSKLALLWKKMIPRHLPLSAFGVQTPREKQNLRFRTAKALHDGCNILGRTYFQVLSLIDLLIQLPGWYINLRSLKKGNSCHRAETSKDEVRHPS